MSTPPSDRRPQPAAAPGPVAYPAHPPRPAAGPPRPRNGLGVAALVLGIVALALCWTVVGGVVLGILGVVFGAVGVRRAARGEATDRGMALAGLITGGVGLVVGVVLLVVIVAGIIGSSRCVQSAGGDPAESSSAPRTHRRTARASGATTSSEWTKG